jgi:hypothetical protein
LEAEDEVDVFVGAVVGVATGEKYGESGGCAFEKGSNATTATTTRTS